MTHSTLISANAETGSRLLEVKGLRIETRGKQPAALIEDVSFSLNTGETLAIVGESGAGKSLTSLAILGLLANDAMAVTSGGIYLEGADITHPDAAALRRLRGGQIAMIFQDPLSCLNPVLTVGRQITETLRLHTALRGAALRRRAVELLELVRIPEPQKRLDEYPHRLSGGMRQRVMIAMALAGEPRILLADEPTTALDVTISAQIMGLLQQLQKDMGLAILLITHDLPAVRMIADRVAVMYSGKIIETASADVIFAKPEHPYTRGLLAARPRGAHIAGAARLTEIAGTVPLPSARPSGCAFRTRCTLSQQDCALSAPVMTGLEHQVACLHPLRSQEAAR